jgi:Ni/Fe-hydrogenase subunit HybB-like protein
MWLERLIIVVPSLANPRLPYPTGIYIPTLTEWMLFAGGISVFILGYLLFAKYFPLISIWEIQEGRDHSVREVSARLESYLPENPQKKETAITTGELVS